MVRKLLSHTAIYGLAPQVPKIASVFTLPIITRYLTEKDFGIYGVITAITGSIAVLNSLGLNVILTNIFFKSPNYYKWAWRQIYGFLIFWSIPFTVLLSALLYFFIPPEASGNAIYIILANVLPTILFGPSVTLGTSYYQLCQKPFQIAVRATVFGLLTVGLNVLFIASLKLGYMGWFLSTGISNLLHQASYWWPLNKTLNIRPIFNFKRRYLKSALKVSLPTVPHFYSAYLIDTSDRIVMKFLNVSIADIGKYNAAYTVANIVQQIGIAAGKATGPMLNSLYKNQKEKEARKLIFTLQIIFFLITFILSIWLKEIFNILIKNSSLSSVYHVGIILIMAYNYRPMYLGANNRLFYYEKTKALLKVTFVAGLLNLVLNLIFIKIFGYMAAAFTTFAALLYMGYAGYFLKVYKQSNIKISYYPFIWLALTIVITIIAYFVVDVPWKGKIIASLIFSVISLLSLLKIRRI